MGWNVEIDVEKCTGDEECVNVCPAGVLEMEDGKAVVVNIDECLGCESCARSLSFSRHYGNRSLGIRFRR